MRRDQDKKKIDKEASPGLAKSKTVLSKTEIQMLNVLIPRDKRKENYKKAVQNEGPNDEISKKCLGESTYEDWYEVKKHDLAEKIPISEEVNVKNMDIRLLINQVDKAMEFTELELEGIESEILFMKEIKEIVDSFNTQMNDLAAKKKHKDRQVCIFDGRKSHKLEDNFPTNQIENEKKEKLNTKFEILTQKRLIISEHLE